MKSRNAKTYGLLLLCAVVLMAQYVYFDCADAVRNSVNLWHALFDGEPLNFYQYTRMAEHNGTFASFAAFHAGATYSYFAYGVFAIWLFPLYLLERFFAVDLFAASWAVMYAKAGLLGISVLSAGLLKRIAQRALPERAASFDWLPLAYLTSALFFSCTVAAGQLEAFTVLFMLLGFERYLRKKPTYVLFFALALPIKYFAAVAFVPLLLVEEKRLLRLFGKLFLFLLPTVSLFLLFRADFSAKVGVLADHEGALRDFAFSILGGGASGTRANLYVGSMSFHYFFAGFFCLCAYCRLAKPETPLQRARVGAFACLGGTLAFLLLFAQVNPYWAVLLVPFSLLAVALSPRPAKALALETLATTLLVWWQILQYPWVYGYYAMQNNAWLRAGIGQVREDITPHEAIVWLGEHMGMPLADYLLQMLSTAALLAFAALVYMLFPRKNQTAPPDALASPDKRLLALRLALSAGTLAVAVIFTYVGCALLPRLP